VISVRNVWKRYGALQVLKGLSLDIHDGETLVILGRSGVGKSVLLKHIIGLEAADAGEILIDGQDITHLRPAEKMLVLKDVGMLFQGSALFDSLNIYENTAFYLRQHKTGPGKSWLPEAEVRYRVLEALDMVGLAGTEKKMPSDLSGGMRKRAALARLIVYRPTVLLYDEPTTGLDPITAMQINELIIQTQRELKATSIVVTHDIPSALTVANRMALHHNGHIAHIAPAAEFLKIDDPIVKTFFENAIPGKGGRLGRPR
jgi:phospholipid/cholesterol/gamma-HCH transport system ATP-binding protein